MAVAGVESVNTLRFVMSFDAPNERRVHRGGRVSLTFEGDQRFVALSGDAQLVTALEHGRVEEREQRAPIASYFAAETERLKTSARTHESLAAHAERGWVALGDTLALGSAAPSRQDQARGLGVADCSRPRRDSANAQPQFLGVFGERLAFNLAARC